MRLRVLINVRKPLKRTKKIRKPGGEAKEVAFKYERLGHFCYLCGMLGHIDDYCELLFSMKEDNGEQRWGPELRAEPRNVVASSGSKWLRREGAVWKTPTNAPQSVTGNQSMGINGDIISDQKTE